MRNIADVIRQLIKEDEGLAEHFDEVLKKVQYLAPELALPHWAEAQEILSSVRPKGHSKYNRLKAIFNGTT